MYPLGYRFLLDEAREAGQQMAARTAWRICSANGWWSVYSNRIVGYSIDSRMKSRLAVAALRNAVTRRLAEGADVAGCIVHSDRGS